MSNGNYSSWFSGVIYGDADTVEEKSYHYYEFSIFQMTLRFFIDKLPPSFHHTASFRGKCGTAKFLLKKLFFLGHEYSHCNLQWAMVVEEKQNHQLQLVRIKPKSPRLIDLFGIYSPFAVFLSQNACLSKRVSWVLPVASVVKWRNCWIVFDFFMSIVSYNTEWIQFFWWSLIISVTVFHY